MVGYIIIAIAVLVLLYIVISYAINSKKIKQKQVKKEEPKKAETSEQKKTEPKPAVVEVNSQVVKGTMFEEAVKEAERQGFKYETSEPETAIKPDNSRLKLDRDEFVPEIKRTEYSRLKPQRLVSERQEGPNRKDKNVKSLKKGNIGEELNNLSPEMKALLINDVLNRKY